MFDYLYEWMQNIAFYLVLVTAVLNIVPNTSYKKYIRFFTGLLMIILLTTPILKVVGMEQTFATIYKNAEYKQKQKEMEETTNYLKNVELDMEKYTQEQPKSEDENNQIQVGEIQIGK